MMKLPPNTKHMHATHERVVAHIVHTVTYTYTFLEFGNRHLSKLLENFSKEKSSNTKLLSLSAAGLSHWSFNRHFRKRRSLRAAMPKQREEGTVMYYICRTSFTTCLDILTHMMQILSISTECIAPGSQIKKKQEKAK